MTFYTRKKRTPSIILVSLIDILAILLIFFIVTTTFRKEQPRLQINLPESKSAEPSAGGTADPLLLHVKSETEIFLGADAVKLDALAAALRAARSREPGRPVAMQADREAAFGVVVKVLDALREADVRNVPAFTQPDPR